jgi:hypothetical protein
VASESPVGGGRRLGAFLRRHRGAVATSIFAVIVLSLVGPTIARQIFKLGFGSEENEPADFVRKRAEWFFRPRASNHGHIPNALRLKAIAQRDATIRDEGTFASHFSPAAITISNSHWTSIGPQPLTNEDPFGTASGRMNALAIDPCDATNNTVYAGAADGGVWRTTDGGTTWTPMTDSQPSISSGSIALVPSGTNCAATTVYYGTGEENFAGDSIYGAGVLKSTNAGGTWAADATFTVGQPQSEFAAAPYIGSLSVKPGNTSVLLAGIQGTGSAIPSGLYLSADGGVHWALHNPTNPSFDFATGAAFDPNDSTGNTAFAAMGYPFGDMPLVTEGDCTAAPCNGVFKSADGGMTWTRLTGLDTAINNALGANSSKKYGRISITVSTPLPAGSGNPANTEIFAAIADGTTSSSRFLAFAKSTNGGTTWSVLTFEPLCERGSNSGQCFYDMALAIQPGNPLVLFAGGAAGAISNSSNPEPTLLRSLDGGGTWADISADNAGHPDFPQIHVDHHAIAFSPDGTKVYIGNDGGVWSSADAMTATAGNQHWTNLNSGLQTLQFYPAMSAHPTNTSIAFGGTQDNGSMAYSGALTWNWLPLCGDGGWTAVGPVSASAFTAFIVCDAVGNGNTIFRSTDSATTFSSADSGINFTQSVAFIPPFVEDPGTPANVYFGTSRLWQSKNAGTSWVSMAGGADLTAGGGDVLTTMAVAPTDSNTVYVASGNAAVRVSTNALNGTSATFTLIVAGLPSRPVTHIAIDPTTPATAYITFSGFSGFGDTDGHIFKTTSTGSSWASIDGDLPNIPVNDLLLDPEDPENTIYAGTDIGVFVTSNGGAHWSTLAPGLPNVEVLSLALQDSNRLLLAGTHGRSAWEFALPAVGTPVPTISALTPTSVSAGSAQFTLTVSGTNFSANCVVNFNGSALTTNTSGQPTSLTATVPATDVAAGGNFPITVTDTGTGKTSAPSTFTVTAPTIASISPTSATAGSAQFPLTVNGSNFTTNSVVNFNGTALTTSTAGEPTSLTGTVTAALIVTAGTFPVTVTDSGVTSNSVNFTVNPATAPDFSFGTITSSPANATVAAGGSVTYTVPINAIGGFSSSVALSCTSGLPAKTTCSTGSGTPSTPGMLTISTTASSIVPVAFRAPRRPLQPLTAAVGFLTAFLAAFFVMRTGLCKRRFAFGFSFAAIALAIALAACGGGGSGGGGGGGGGTPGTPAGTYTVTLTGTAGTTTHTATVPLIVSP